MSANIHVSDVGSSIVLTFYDQDDTVIDISTASTKQIWISDPDGNKTEKSGTFYTDGTDGKLMYTLQSGDIDETGLWKVQGYVVIGTGYYHSSVEPFTVEANL